MSMIQVNDLTFSYDGAYDLIFDHVSFQIDSNWKLGLIGRNGRGKTTFLKLLCNKYEYQGKIHSSIEFEYFPYEIEDTGRITADITEEICPGYETWQIIKECNLLGIDDNKLYQQFNTLSHGEQTKILLAVMFVKENKFLLIDEPTNHLDREAREIVAKYLSKKKGFILVSHDRSFLDACVDHILSINKANIEVQKGTFSSWYENQKNQEQLELAQNKKLKSEIRRLDEAARQASVWSDQVEKTKKGNKVAGLRPDRGHIGHQAAKMMKRSKTLENRYQDAIEEKSKLLKNLETVDLLKLFPLNYHTQKLAVMEELAVFYGEKKVFDGLKLEIHQGDRICLTGPNGCGKSSLLKLVLGEPLSHTGNFSVASGLKISYVSQDTSNLRGSLDDFVVRWELDETLFLAVLRKLDFSRNQFEKNMEDFSGGQKKKVLLAKSLCEKAHLYIWDEPLNFIDIFSRMQIEELILTYRPTILFVEHDKKFSDRIATRSFEFLGEKLK